MEKLDWGKRLVFANVREYYETLGFLCKEKEVIKIYIEDNRKAGARGIQGRLRIVEGNYKSFKSLCFSSIMISIDALAYIILEHEEKNTMTFLSD